MISVLHISKSWCSSTRYQTTRVNTACDWFVNATQCRWQNTFSDCLVRVHACLCIALLSFSSRKDSDLLTQIHNGSGTKAAWSIRRASINVIVFSVFQVAVSVHGNCLWPYDAGHRGHARAKCTEDKATEGRETTIGRSSVVVALFYWVGCCTDLEFRKIEFSTPDECYWLASSCNHSNSVLSYPKLEKNKLYLLDVDFTNWWAVVCKW